MSFLLGLSSDFKFQISRFWLNLKAWSEIHISRFSNLTFRRYSQSNNLYACLKKLPYVFEKFLFAIAF